VPDSTVKNVFTCIHDSFITCFISIHFTYSILARAIQKMIFNFSHSLTHSLAVSINYRFRILTIFHSWTFKCRQQKISFIYYFYDWSTLHFFTKKNKSLFWFCLSVFKTFLMYDKNALNNIYLQLLITSILINRYWWFRCAQA
jgi:hypothetical protein